MAQGPARPKILVVEDESSIALDIMLMVQRAGAEPIGPAATLAAAVEVARTGRFDAALLDITLHKKESVYPLADALRKRSIPFAFVSGLSAEDVAPRFAGVAFFQKPIAINALEQWVQTLATARDEASQRAIPPAADKAEQRR